MATVATFSMILIGLLQCNRHMSSNGMLFARAEGFPTGFPKFTHGPTPCGDVTNCSVYVALRAQSVHYSL